MRPLDLDRRRDVGDLLGTTFRLFGEHLAVFTTLTIIVVAPVVILVDGVWGRALVDGPDADPPAGASLASVLLSTLVIPAMVTALHVCVVQGLARGEEPTVSTAMAQAADRVGPAIATVALYSLLVLVGLIAFVIPGIWLAVRFYLGAQAAVIDRLPPSVALARSAQLVQGSWWRTFGLLLLAGLIVGVLAGFLSGLASITGSGPLFVTLLIIAQTVALSLGAIFGTLLFFDLRTRKELPWEGSRLPDPAAPERPLR